MYIILFHISVSSFNIIFPGNLKAEWDKDKNRWWETGREERVSQRKAVCFHVFSPVYLCNYVSAVSYDALQTVSASALNEPGMLGNEVVTKATQLDSKQNSAEWENSIMSSESMLESEV